MNDKRPCAGQGRAYNSAIHLFLSICIYGDIEIEAIYTDTHFKTTSPKNERGLRSENRLRGHAAGGRYMIVYIVQESAAETDVGRRHRESRRGWPAHAQGNNKRLSATDYGGVGVLEIQHDGNVRGALRLIRTYLKKLIFDRYLPKEGR